MGYRVKPLQLKKRSWKVQYESYTGGRRKIRDLPEQEYGRLGFRRDMTLAEAQARKDQLNAEDELKRQEARRIAIAARLSTEELVLSAFLPEQDQREFEATYLFTRGDDPKRLSHWRTAKRCIADLKMPPQDWEANKQRFYGWFSKRKDSLSYVHKVLRIINEWGKWQARKYRTPYLVIPPPTKYEKERINDAYFSKRERGMESDPLTPAQLETARASLAPEHWRYLFLSLWLGLRPPELAHAASGRHLELFEQDGVPVVGIFQTKLKSLRREDRWKYIPCVEPEQREAYALLKQALPFTAPSGKILKSRFTPDTRLHAGRKGFTDLMLDRGYKLEDIVSWLGHRSIETTWRKYKNKRRVHIPKAA